MVGKKFDLVIVGGGLAGCLFLHALKAAHPKMSVLLLEKNDHLCGNHTWCLHEADIPPGAESWLRPLLSVSWQGYDVKFPSFERTLSGRYHCVRAEELAQKTLQQHGEHVRLSCEVFTMKETGTGHVVLQLRGGDIIESQLLVLARGWSPLQDSPRVAWQKFVGLEVKLKNSHGLARPILKDVRVPQTDGYRFVYSLPFSEREVLIEDTYYSNHSKLDVEGVERGIEDYAKTMGWEIERILRREVGALPLGLEAPKFASSQWPRLGAESNFFNPVTGYTMPLTLRNIQALLESSSLTRTSMLRVQEREFLREKSRLQYYAILNRMMFIAAKSEERYRILERFYRLPEGLIDRFYSSQLTLGDRFRILCGKPPVPIVSAIRAIRTKFDEA